MEKIRVYYEEEKYYLLVNDRKTLVEFAGENAPKCESGYADINLIGGSLDTYIENSTPEIKLVVEDWEYA